MTGSPPPNSGQPPPSSLPPYAQVLNIVAPPWTAVGEDIIRKNQTPPPQNK
jgi:hypothetical protein